MLKQPVVNVEEQPGKTGPEAYDEIVQAATEVMPRLPFPKGVYKFRSHEEANAWTEKHILEGIARRTREIELLKQMLHGPNAVSDEIHGS